MAAASTITPPADGPRRAADFLDFVNASPSPFHAVDSAASRLKAASFVELNERDVWNLQKGGKYFFTRNKSSLIAFSVGGKYAPGHGFSMVAAHSDSPCLKVKPVSKVTTAGYLQVGVEPYGGGLWHTWFDRELGLAGRVIVRDGDKFTHRLVRVARPIMRIPNLAIHLDRSVKEGFKFNDQDHLLPILATAVSQLNAPAAPAGAKHHPLLLSILAKELGCATEAIEDFELSLFDVVPSTIGGACEEFIFSARLDNLMMSYCAVEGLIAASGLDEEKNVRVAVMFDNEEVGSQSEHGADSTILTNAIARIQAVFGDESRESSERSVRKSFLVSADMAHGVHPNYAGKHEENHRPQIHKGPVIKFNANQRYATTAVTAFIIREIGRRNGVPMQDFVVRNDSPCGSTIGPISSGQVGVRTVDIGNPMLSMHSIRETCGVDDTAYAVTLLKSFYEQFTQLDESSQL